MRVTCSLIGLPLELSERIGVWDEARDLVAVIVVVAVLEEVGFELRGCA